MPKINPKDLVINTYTEGRRPAWVNKPETGVQITHLPTAITIKYDGKRSQHHSKVQAMALLGIELYKLLNPPPKGRPKLKVRLKCPT